MKLVLVLLGLLMFLMTYVLPMVTIPVALSEIFSTPVGWLAAIAYSVAYFGFIGWMALKVKRGEIVLDRAPDA
jgi:hypothetical protein